MGFIFKYSDRSGTPSVVLMEKSRKVNLSEGIRNYSKFWKTSRCHQTKSLLARRSKYLLKAYPGKVMDN